MRRAVKRADVTDDMGCDFRYLQISYALLTVDDGE